jgi:hypothetical protein
LNAAAAFLASRDTDPDSEARAVWRLRAGANPETRIGLQFFQSEDFFRALHMSGKTERLAFIGTQADGIDVDEAGVELGLDDDLSTGEVVAANNKAARSALADSLTELAFNLADQSGRAATAAPRSASPGPIPAGGLACDKVKDLGSGHGAISTLPPSPGLVQFAGKSLNRLTGCSVTSRHERLFG